MSEEVRYEDVPTGAVFVGHDGIEQMGAGALAMSADMCFDIGQRVAGQDSYAFETICHGTNTGAIGPLPGTGAPFRFRGISIGAVSGAGLVTSQRDYWDWRDCSDSSALESDVGRSRRARFNPCDKPLNPG